MKGVAPGPSAPSPRTASGTSPSTTRTTSCRPCPRATPGTPCGPGSCGACTASPSPPARRRCIGAGARTARSATGRRARHTAVLGADVAGGHGGARTCWPRDWGVSADAWSVTSYTELREDALSVERANRLHPHAERAVPYVTGCTRDGAGPVVAVTDYMRAVPDQVARWVPRPFVSLGTDGFGRSDTRAALRRFFEVDAAHLVVAVLSALADAGEAKATRWPRPSPATASTPTPSTPGPPEPSRPRKPTLAPAAAVGPRLRTALGARLDMAENRDRDESTEPTEKAEPIEKAERNEPIEPIGQGGADRADRQERALGPDRQERVLGPQRPPRGGLSSEGS